MAAATIEGWLGQFEKEDQDLAARVLDAIDYYDQTQISASLRGALGSIPGWDPSPAKRRGKWVFAAMSGSAGESGDHMLYQFRIANSLDANALDDMFLTRSDLFRRPMLPADDSDHLGADDVVVLLDDFSGTGRQACDAWNDPETAFGSLLTGVGRVYFIVVLASLGAKKRIREETQMVPIPAHELRDADNIFSESCKHFSEIDQGKLMKYCTTASKQHPRGYGDCGFVVVFQHRTPNNSIPVLHSETSHWTGLFPRHD